MSRLLIPAIVAATLSGSLLKSAAHAAPPAYQRAVVLLGDPQGKLFGTGVVVSRKHRLVVTNSHVAECYLKNRRMSAMINGTRRSYKVKRFWYHPGVVRHYKNQKGLHVRSMNPYDGETYGRSPDLALLQLDSTGPDLPAEMPLATADDLKSLQGKSIRIFGYPGSDNKGWPKTGSIARATIDRGTVRNLYNFEMSARANDGENQFVQHSMPTIGGFSGSPLFLDNGRIVAIHNSTITFRDRKMAHGIRIDCLWELLVYHKLTDKLPIPVKASSLNIERWRKKYPGEEKVRKAYGLFQQAEKLLYTDYNYNAAAAKCNEALKLAKFAKAYRTRGMAYNNYVFRSKNLSRRSEFEYLKLALSDFEEYQKLAMTDDQVVDSVMSICLVLNNLGNSFDPKHNRKALELLDEVKSKAELSKFDNATWHSSRAIALANLGRTGEALKHHNKAIELVPNNAVFRQNRASYYRARGRYDLARTDEQKARELRKKK